MSSPVIIGVTYINNAGRTEVEYSLYAEVDEFDKE